jgi:putative endonuclease
MDSKIKNDKRYFVYILECADNSLYTGYTVDIQKRLDTHNSKKGAKYTSARLPVKLVFFIERDSKSDALKLEAWIKKLPKQKKLSLINTMKL